MASQDPNRDQRGAYAYYQPPQAQYYHYPDPSTTQQHAYAPIYAAPLSYTPPMLSPQQSSYSTSDYQSHGEMTLTQAQYAQAQAQAEAQYAATTSQPPSQYAISDAPSSSSIEDPDVKRQRNTAASARFRAKKKQREQELQASERAKREALQRLQGKVKDLEDENRFLKDLILTPKAKRKGRERIDEEDDGDVTEGPGERKGRKGKDGVGTK
jgi:hypothetical protein